MELKLGDVQTTALIPLAVKANETLRKNTRIKDTKAVEIIRTLKIDTKPYDKFMSHEGVVARTIMLDRQLKGIIKKAPDTVVVNVGAGFDNRFSRIDNGRILWFDIDLPDAIAARKKAFPEQERVTMTAGGALALALGIAIQNFPEGAIISMPLHAEGKSKGKAFADGVLSGAVEPVGAILTIISARLFLPIMPYLLSFAAGAMIYVVVEELIPEMSEGEHSDIGVILFSVGFTLMMILDVALG